MSKTHAKRRRRGATAGPLVNEAGLIDAGGPARRRSPLTRMQLGARDLGVRAQTRARGEIDRRRSSAADTLESLALALRPVDPLRAAHARRKTMAIAGGSGLALVAALGAGMALGLMLSRQLKKRAEHRPHEGAGEHQPTLPEAMAEDQVTAGLNL